jgi:hypothetical protein
MDYRLSIEIELLEEGVYLASCPAIQGCHAEGRTIGEALDNLLRSGLTEQRSLRQMARTFRHIKIEGKDAFVLFDTGSLRSYERKRIENTDLRIHIR